jgi:hypothetical protein
MTCRTLFCLIAATITPLTTALAAEGVRPTPIGGKVSGLEFKDIRYLACTLDDFGAKKAFVIVFVNRTCPLVKRYLPELVRLDREYHDRGVQFMAVNAGADDTIVDTAAQAVEAGAEFPFVKDREGVCSRALGVSRTPGVVVIDGEHRLRYRGRIDDQNRLGGSRPAASRHDLREAIEEVLNGRDVVVPETTVDGCLITAETIAEPEKPLTFGEHVGPIIRKHCQECHRSGAEGPFPLVTYRDVRSQSAMIAEVVADRRMPPWYASQHHGQIVNARTLPEGDRLTILQWIRSGMAKGDLSKLPKPAASPPGSWRIGEPDLIVAMTIAHSVPADGYVDYRFAILPHMFLQDTWVQALEIMPDNPAVVHHCNMAYLKAGERFKGENFITGRVPGGDPMVLDDGVAYKIPAGSVLGLQIHYVTTGKPERCRISVGLRFPRATVHHQLDHKQVFTNAIRIPPVAPAYEISARRTLDFDAIGVGMFSHMHLRGKDMTFLARYPDGQVETLLLVPNYSFEWQQSYRWAPGTKRFPKGTTFQVVAHFDNSALNPYNPDPKATVVEGDQTFNEMMYGFFFYMRDHEDLNLAIDPKTGHVLSRAPQASEEELNRP